MEIELEDKPKKPKGLPHLESLLADYLKAQGELSKARDLPNAPRVIATQFDLEAYEQHLQAVQGAGAKADAAREQMAMSKAHLLDALPYPDIWFKLKVGSKEYGVKREDKTPPELSISEWDNSLVS